MSRSYTDTRTVETTDNFSSAKGEYANTLSPQIQWTSIAQYAEYPRAAISPDHRRYLARYHTPPRETQLTKMVTDT